VNHGRNLERTFGRAQERESRHKQDDMPKYSGHSTSIV